MPLKSSRRDTFHVSELIKYIVMVYVRHIILPCKKKPLQRYNCRVCCHKKVSWKRATTFSHWQNIPNRD